MNWLKNKLNTWRTKSTLGKVSDLLFFLILVLMVTPGGRIFYQRMLLKTGIYNINTSFYQEETVLSSEDWNSSFYDRSGNLRTLAEFKGKVLFINQWATWCPPCKAEFPSVSNISGIFNDQENIEFLLLTPDNFQRVDQFIHDYESRKDLPVYQTHQLTETFGNSLPTTLIIDKQGKIAFKKTGMAQYDTPSFIRSIQSLL